MQVNNFFAQVKHSSSYWSKQFKHSFIRSGNRVMILIVKKTQLSQMKKTNLSWTHSISIDHRAIMPSDRGDDTRKGNDTQQKEHKMIHRELFHNH